MGKTAIEYGDRTWNFFPGCNGPDGKPCSYCFAQNRILPRMACEKCRTGKPHFHPERFEEPLHVRKPARWLVCFTGDLFGDWVEPFLVAESLNIMRKCPQHIFLCLTKQPQNLAKFSPFPENAWVGVSATNSEQFTEAHKHLLRVRATARYISFEPLLERIIYQNYRIQIPLAECCDWVIIGQQTPVKASTAPKVEWVREIVEAADRMDIPVFLKNNLRSLFSDWKLPDACLTAAGFLRQEMPEEAT